MKVERIDRVILNVRNLEESVRFWSDVFGLVFPAYAPKGKVQHLLSEHAGPVERSPSRPAVSPFGIELLQKVPPVEPEGIRSLALEVADIDAAKAELKAKKVRLLQEIVIDGFREAFFHPDDLHGVRLALVSYSSQRETGNKGAQPSHPLKLEKLDRVGLNVLDCAQAEKFWTDTLGLYFPPKSHDPDRIRQRGAVTHTYTQWATPDDKARPIAAIASIGLEIMQRDPPLGIQGFRGIVLKVSDLVAARAHMLSKGMRLQHTITVGDIFKEDFFHPDDTHGVRIALCEYKAPEPTLKTPV